MYSSLQSFGSIFSLVLNCSLTQFIYICFDVWNALPKKSQHSVNATNDQDTGDNEPDGVDKSVVKLTKAEKRTKIKRMRKEAKKQSKEVAEVEEVEETPQTAVLVLILMQPIANDTYFLVY